MRIQDKETSTVKTLSQSGGFNFIINISKLYNFCYFNYALRCTHILEKTIKNCKFYRRVVELYENFYAKSSFIQRARYMISYFDHCIFSWDILNFDFSLTAFLVFGQENGH